MPPSDQGTQAGIILTTALATFVSGFLFGIFTSRGYLIPPSLVDERRHYFEDPIESDESDIDEKDSVLDHAPNWSNGLHADERQGLRASGVRRETVRPPAPVENDDACKLVLVVRTDLGMTKGTANLNITRASCAAISLPLTSINLGKIAAQCSHATLACYKALSRPMSGPSDRKTLSRWERQGQAKIALQVKDEEEMLELLEKARSMGLTAEIIRDAGRTQIDPGTVTVLGIGPAPIRLIDQITGHLKLL